MLDLLDFGEMAPPKRADLSHAQTHKARLAHAALAARPGVCREGMFGISPAHMTRRVYAAAGAPSRTHLGEYVEELIIGVHTHRLNLRNIGGTLSECTSQVQ